MTIRKERDMKMKHTLLLLSLAGALALCSCTKEVLRTCGRVLGEKTVSSAEGDFLMLVTTDGVWSAASLSSWITVDESLHKGRSTVRVQYASNASSFGDNRFNRLGKVVIVTWDGGQADTLVIRQRGLDPVFQSVGDAVVPLAKGRYSIAVSTNFSDRERPALTFAGGAPWMRDVSFGDDGQSILLDVDEARAERRADVTVRFIPEWGDPYTTVIPVTQK